ncbi:unnamed protein product [Schistosoma rodhaini]|nr:unnamed protein product [Schistosoma rodhaini]
MALEDSQTFVNKEFLTGVVEGFYFRPWTYPQRKQLFRRMNQMGMNAYLYAPKDDIKHRQSCRDSYTQEEEQQLQFLITESTEAGVLFIFAISPGFDVTFSSAKEVDILKKKVDQVLKLGCRAFALLFDDIKPRLCPADREVFNSSARAHVMFANEIYNHLGCPDVFLFCPTGYSESLAVPNTNKSEYLATVASCLTPGIAVIWTGPLVVSKRTLAKELKELFTFLQHPIVLWDNLHVNDYDQRRVFIGPYSGRPLALRHKGLLGGVLTNPNCEFEANYVAFHTLAQWSRKAEMLCTSEDFESNASDDNEMIVDGIDYQKSGDINEHPSVCQDDCVNRKRQYASVYRPREALRIALRDWLALMLQAGASKPSTAIGTPTPMDTDNLETGQNEATVQIESTPSNVVMIYDNNSSETPISGDVNTVAVTLEDLEMFADLFYLPFSHVSSAIRLPELGHWLCEYSAKEVDILKKKVDQVLKLGCRAFALLFDDIKPRLCPADREVFNSSARAHVMFANEIYNHLGCPDVFLFCPTGYSESLAVPNTNKSEYLATVASCLTPGIAVIWTGPLVVSKRTLAKELKELFTFLQHPIVLWDNLHVNDYDQRRVFIGPYSGRPLALRHKGLLGGVLTNPNCEFEANYVAFHTLAQWSRKAEMLCTSEDFESNASDDNEMIVDGIDYQKSGDINEHPSVCQDDCVNRKRQYASVYRPREALRIALRDWLALMLQAGASKPSTAIGTPTPMDTDNLETGQNEATVQIESTPSNVVMIYDNNSSETPISGDVNTVAVTLEDLEMFADLFYLPFSHVSSAIRLPELGHWLCEYSYVCHQ